MNWWTWLPGGATRWKVYDPESEDGHADPKTGDYLSMPAARSIRIKMEQGSGWSDGVGFDFCDSFIHTSRSVSYGCDIAKIVPHGRIYRRINRSGIVTGVSSACEYIKIVPLQNELKKQLSDVTTWVATEYLKTLDETSLKHVAAYFDYFFEMRALTPDQQSEFQAKNNLKIGISRAELYGYCERQDWGNLGGLGRNLWDLAANTDAILSRARYAFEYTKFATKISRSMPKGWINTVEAKFAEAFDQCPVQEVVS